MKSLKSVLVVAFACAMLFAFTACEQQPIDVLGYNPTAVEVTQNGTIITGQPLTADMFTATVTYANGQTGTVGVQIDEEAGTVTATVNNDIENTLTVKYTDPQSATVEAEFASQTVRPNETQSTTLTGTISAITLMANEASYVLPQAEFTDYTATVTLTAEQRSTAAVYDDLAITLSASGSGSIATESVGTVTVIGPEADPVVARLQAFYTIDSDTYTTLPQLYIGDSVSVAFYLVDEDGEKIGEAVSLANPSSGATTLGVAQIISNDGFTLSGTSLSAIEVAADTDATISVRYYGDNGEVYNASAEVGNGIDSIATITSVGTVANLPEGVLSTTSIAVTGTTLVNSESHILGADDPSYQIVFDETYTVPASTAANGITVNLTLTYRVNGEPESVRYTITNVKAAE